MKLGGFEVTEPVPELNAPHALANLRPWMDVGGKRKLTRALFNNSRFCACRGWQYSLRTRVASLNNEVIDRPSL